MTDRERLLAVLATTALLYSVGAAPQPVVRRAQEGRHAPRALPQLHPPRDRARPGHGRPRSWRCIHKWAPLRAWRLAEAPGGRLGCDRVVHARRQRRPPQHQHTRVGGRRSAQPRHPVPAQGPGRLQGLGVCGRAHLLGTRPTSKCTRSTHKSIGARRLPLHHRRRRSRRTTSWRTSPATRTASCRWPITRGRSSTFWA